MRLRVSRLTTGLPRNARDTVGCDTPARNAMSKDVGFSCIECGAFLSTAPSSGAIMHGAIGEKLLHRADVKRRQQNQGAASVKNATPWPGSCKVALAKWPSGKPCPEMASRTVMPGRATLAGSPDRLK